MKYVYILFHYYSTIALTTQTVIRVYADEFNAYSEAERLNVLLKNDFESYGVEKFELQ